MSLRVKSKLLIMFGGYILLVLSLVSASVIILLTLQHEAEYLYNVHFEAVEKLLTTERAVYMTDSAANKLIIAKRQIQAGRINEYLNNIRIYRKEIKQSFEEYQKILTDPDPDSAASIQDYLNNWKTWDSAYNIFLTLLYEGGDSIDKAEEKLQVGDIGQSFTKMANAIDILMQASFIEVHRMNNVMTANIARSLLAVSVISALIIILSIIQLRLFNKLIFSHVVNISRRLKQIAEGDGDLTLTLAVKRMDEFGILSGNFNNFINNIKDSIVTVKEVAKENAELKDNLAAGNQEVSSSIIEISSNLNSIRNTVSNLNDTVKSADDGITHVDTAIRDLDERVENQASMVEESSAAVTEMISSINNVSAIAERQKEAADVLLEKGKEGSSKLATTSDAVSSINESITSITKMTAIISSIAAQTNLLAMNAAIEAAHAGNAGRGFAVVADEIRKLAESTSKQSKEISSVLKDVVSRISNADQASDESRQSYEQLFVQIEKVTQVFSEISMNMNELNVGGKQILEAMDSLQQVSQETRTDAREMKTETVNITDQISLLSRISSEVVQAIDEINTGIREINEASQLVGRISTDLNNSSDKLINQVGRFKT